MRAKGEDLIRAGGRHRKGDEATGESESIGVALAAGSKAVMARNDVAPSRSRLILSSQIFVARPVGA